MASPSETLNSDDPETLLSHTDAAEKLCGLSEDKIASLAHQTSCLGTSEGPITDQKPSVIFAACTVALSDNQSWVLEYKCVIFLLWRLGLFLADAI
jgi:hypothetical protein